MGTIEQKFNYTFEAKEEIKQATNALGGDLTDDSELKDYAEALRGVYDSLPKVTGEGTEVTLTPTRKGRLALIPKGNSEQGQKKSPNLYNVNDFISGLDYSVDSEGFITLAYDNTSGSTTRNSSYHTDNLDIQASTTYLLVAEIKSVSGEGTIYFTNRQGNTNQGQFPNFYKRFDQLSNGEILTEQITSISAESMASVTRGLRTVVTFGAGKSGSITFRLSVLEDTTITPQTFHYLPFGNLDPQPYFPIPIKSVTGNNNVVVINQLFSSNLEQGTLSSADGSTSPSTSRLRTIDFISLEGSTTYNIACSDTTGFCNRVFYYQENGTYISIEGNFNTWISTFTTPDNCKKIKMIFRNSSNTTINVGDITGIKLYKDSQTKPLNLGSIELNKIGNYQDYIYKTTGKNLLDTSTIRTVLNDGGNERQGFYYKIEESGTYTIDFSNTSNAYYYGVSNGLDQNATNTKISSTTATFTGNYTAGQYIVMWHTIAHANERISIVKGSSALNPFEPYGSGKWYKKEVIGKLVLNGTENWNIANTGTANWYYQLTSLTPTPSVECKNATSGMCSHYPLASVGNSNTNTGIYMTLSGQLRIRYGTEDTKTNFTTWLSTHNVTLYYIIEATDIEITNTTLIEQLEEIDKMKSYEGTTIITSTFDSNNAQMIISASALKGE